MASQPERLLVVDDDGEIRDMLSRRLSRRGYAVDVAEDGETALDKIAKAHYDLVLLDQVMPGMGGLDLLRLLRATYSRDDLPVIMMAQAGQAGTLAEALDGGANDYVVTPADLPVMTARIAAHLSRAKSDRQGREGEQRPGLSRTDDGWWEWDLVQAPWSSHRDGCRFSATRKASCTSCRRSG
jgi:DNA-binding response OmpR family regulator